MSRKRKLIRDHFEKDATMTGNGQQEAKPTLKIVFDPATQSIALEFDPKEIKTWEFTLAMLEMARSQAEFRLALARAENMQRAQMQEMQMQQMKGQILRGQ